MNVEMKILRVDPDNRAILVRWFRERPVELQHRMPFDAEGAPLTGRALRQALILDALPTIEQQLAARKARQEETDFAAIKAEEGHEHEVAPEVEQIIRAQFEGPRQGSNRLNVLEV